MTPNYDRDRKWGYCYRKNEKKKKTDKAYRSYGRNLSIHGETEFEPPDPVLS